MATRSPEGSERGRSSLPGRSPRAYSASPSGRSPVFGSQFSYKKEPSPHLSYDKITRHASPSRRESDREGDSIVPKVPQPYRTSFSAVTSPYRVPRRSTDGVHSPLVGHGLIGLTRNSPGRATMPVSVSMSSQHAKSEDLLAASPSSELSASQKSPVSPPYGQGSYGNILESVSKHNSGKAEDGKTSFVRSDVRYSSTPASVRGRVLGRATATSTTSYGAPCQEHRSESVTDSVFTDGATDTPEAPLNEKSVRAFMENTDPDKVLANGRLHSPSEGLLEDTVQIKTLISKEYVHQQSVSYFQLLEKEKKKKLSPPNEQTNRFMNLILKSGFNRSHSVERPAKVNHGHLSSEGKPSKTVSRSVEDILEDKTVMSNASLPSEVLASVRKDHKEPQVKKSHSSSSIWNILRRLSPKSFRKGRRSLSLGRNSDKSSKENTPSGSDTSLHLVAVDITEDGDDKSQDSQQGVIKPGKSRQSRRKSPKLPKSKNKSKKVSQSGSLEDLLGANSASKTSSDMSTPPAVTGPSARIFRSIEDNALASQEKSVYQAFKEKQSPKQPREAVSLRPQALRPVEFPDTLLHKPKSESSPDASPSDPLPGEKPRGLKPAEQSAPRSRPPEPPRTLDVKNAAQMGKSNFQCLSMSEESIGECSLDVQHTGSEPSLTSRNGQSKPSSVDASKHTLHSRDDIRAATTPTKVQVASIKSSNSQSNPENHVTSNYVTSRILSIEGSTDEVDSHKVIEVSSAASESPKTPSYLKLSCAISGYNKYNSYANGPANTTSPVSPPGDSGRITVLRKSPGGEGELTPVNSIVQNGHCEGHEISRSNGHKFDLELENQVNLDTSKSHTHSCRLTNGAIPEAAADRKSSRDACRRHSGTDVQSEHSNTPTTVSTAERDDRAPLVNGSTNEVSNGGHMTPTQRLSPKTQDVSTPNKDGAYFLQVVDSEEQRLKKLCANAERHLQNDIPEEASGKLRAAIGKANLLTSKKFKQFRGLCNQNMSQSGSEPFHTTSQDLAGFWDMVLIQVEDMQLVFSDLDRLRQNGWNSPVREKQSLSTIAARTPRGKSAGVKDVPAQTPKTSKSKEAARAREEARKRLLAAKRAGRQRKASQSDDVEIFLS